MTNAAVSLLSIIATTLGPSRAGEDRRGRLVQAARFCVVGGTGYVVNLAVYTAILWLTGAPYLEAATFAFAAAWATTFVGNKFWTFQKHTLSPLQQSARCLVVSLVSLGLNLAVLHALVSAGGNEVLAQALAIVAVAPVNFVLNRHWAFL